MSEENDPLKMQLGFLAGAKYGKKIYFSAKYLNGLFSFDISSGKIELIKVFEKECVRKLLHIEAVLNGHEMWLIPVSADNVACVNLNTFEIEYYPVPGWESIGKNYSYVGGLVDKGFVYLLPLHAKSFLRVNMNLHTVEEICKVPFDTWNWARGGYIKKGKIGLINTDGELGIEIDIDKGTVKQNKKKVYSPEDYQYSIQTEDFVWITPFRAGSIKRIEISNGTEILLPIPNSDELFHRGFNLGKYVVMMPAGDGRDFLMIDKETNSVHKLTGDFKGIRSKNTEWFEMCEISADQGYWCAASDGNIFEFSEYGQIVNTYATETEVETIKMTMNKVYQDKQMPIEWMLDDIALERPGIGDLSDFIINI